MRKQILNLLAASGAGLSLCIAGETAIVIDNSDPGFSDHIPDAPETDHPFAAFGGSAHHSLDALTIPTPVFRVTWTFAGLDPRRTHDVAVTWGMIWPAGNLEGDAAYTITGLTEETRNLMHNNDPIPDYEQVDDGGDRFKFQTLARLRPDADGTIVLELKDEDGDPIEAVVADAALVCPIPSPALPVLSVESLDLENNEIHLLLDGIMAGDSYRILQNESLDGEFTDTAARNLAAR